MALALWRTADGPLLTSGGALVTGESEPACLDCCGGSSGPTPSPDPCFLCTGITPLYWDITFAGFGCCCGSAFNTTIRLTQISSCAWLGTKALCSGTVTVQLTKDITGWILDWSYDVTGDTLHWFLATGSPFSDCASPLGDIPTFGTNNSAVCAACSPTATASATPA